MQITFNKSDLESSNSRAVLVSLVTNAPKSGFIRIHGFKSKGGFGEIQDTTYCKGISYKNAVDNSLVILDEMRDDANFSITVTRGVWRDSEGNISPTGRKNKVFNIEGTETKTYTHNDEALQEAIANVYKSLVAPEPTTKEYKSLGNGIYEDETGTIYLRDLRLVKKDIVVKGDYPHKASGEIVAIADAIKRNMPVGKYRMFRLDADFDSLSIGGTELKPDTETLARIEQAKVKITSDIEEDVIDNS